MDSVASANDEAASSSNVDIITNSDQDAIMKKEAAAEAASSSNDEAEGTYMDPQLYDAAVEGNIEPFKDIARELNSIITPNKNTILHINIMSRNRSSMETSSTKFVEDILDRCPSLLLQVNVNAETPLHVAAKYGHSDMVEVLIKSTAKSQHEELESGIESTKKMLRMTNNEGNTALHEAVKYKHLDVVKILTREDPGFSYSSNKRGETPLYIAAAAVETAAAVAAGAVAATAVAGLDIPHDAEKVLEKDLEIVVDILENFTIPAYEIPDQMTSLHAATMINKRPDITRKVLEKKKSLIKERDRYGWTPLHYAAYHKNCDTMKALLKCDISTAYIGDEHRKMTPLHIAISRGYIPYVLLSRCPDCCVLVDKRRWNVLHFAMLSLTEEDLKFLLKNYPLIRNLINDKDVDGSTPLHLLATFRSHLLWRIQEKDKDIKLDFGVVNNQNMSVVGVLNSRMMESGSRQLEEEILKLEEAAGPYRDGIVRVRHEEPSRGDGVDREAKEEEIKEIEKTKESHLIVAALIATVTFTAAFTLPGGVIQEGDKEGTAILSKKAAFQAFVITDAIAMVLSVSAVFTHVLMSLLMKGRKGISTQAPEYLLNCGAMFTMIAMEAMMIAFVTGTYAVLTTSIWLAILTSFIGLTFFLFRSFFLFRCLIWMRAKPIMRFDSIRKQIKAPSFVLFF